MRGLQHRGDRPLSPGLRGSIAASLGALLLGACGDEGTAPPPAPAARIAFDALPDTVAVGDTLAVGTRVLDAAGAVLADSVAWLTSSDAAVLAIRPDGRQHALAEGTALLRASLGGKVRDSVRVLVRRLPRAVRIVLHNDSLVVGESLVLPQALLVDGLGAPMSNTGEAPYFSADTLVLRVDSITGRVAAAGPGSAQVVARVRAYEGRATLRASYWSPLRGLPVALDRVQTGAFHMCGMTSDGRAMCDGSPTFLALGIVGGFYQTVPPVAAGVPSQVTSVRVGGMLSCAVTSGEAWCWGPNDALRMIDSASNIVRGVQPTRLPLPTAARAVADVAISPFEDACVLTAAGAAWCWGPNESGAIGARIAADSTQFRFRRIDAPVAFTQLALGYSHGCGIATDATLWCWGGTHDPNHVRRGVPPGTAERIELPVTPRQVVTSTASTCILDDAGAVWCWGRNAHGQFGTGFTTSNTYVGPTRLSLPGRVVALRAGSAATCAIEDGGELWCWGRIDGLARSPYRFAPGTRFTDVALSNRDAYSPSWSTVCGLATTGRAYCSRWMR